MSLVVTVPNKFLFVNTHTLVRKELFDKKVQSAVEQVEVSGE